MQTLKVVSLIVATSMFAAACGDSMSSLNPTAPSPLAADALSAEASGAHRQQSASARPANGNGNGNGNRPDNPGPPSNPGIPSPLPPGLAKVEIQGRISALTASSVTVDGRLVLVTPATVLRFRSAPAVLADFGVGDLVHVRASRTSLAADASLEAIEIMLQNPARDGDADDPVLSSFVSVAAIDASASEAGGNVGVFRLTRSGDPMLLASPLVVTFSLTGTAVNGTDYVSMPLTAEFVGGVATLDLTVMPRADGVPEPVETVVLTLTGVAPYAVGTPATATVNISDTALPLVSADASDSQATEAGDPGQFLLRRSGSTTNALTVTVAFSGSAVNGVDYETLSTSVTFAAGSATATLDVRPLADTVADPSEMVILTVLDGADYDLAFVFNAVITISGT